MALAGARDKTAIMFRVDARPEAGGGHLGRCLAVAQEAKALAPVKFLLDDTADTAHRRCRAMGFETNSVNDESADVWGLCVLDGYQFGAEEFRRYAAQAPLVVFDDFCDPPDEASLVINAAPHLKGLDVAGVPALLGPEFAAIDPRFSEIPAQRQRTNVAHILLTFGQTNAYEVADLVIDALARLHGTEFDPQVTLILLRDGARTSALEAKIEQSGCRVDWRDHVDDMPDLLGRTDMVIGAGGVSLLERMAAGVPSVTLSIAENQRAYVAGAATRGATIDAGAADTVSIDVLAAEIGGLAHDADRRATMSAAGRATVDGRGAGRIAAAMAKLLTEAASVGESTTR